MSQKYIRQIFSEQSLDTFNLSLAAGSVNFEIRTAEQRRSGISLLVLTRFPDKVTMFPDNVTMFPDDRFSDTDSVSPLVQCHSC